MKILECGVYNKQEFFYPFLGKLRGLNFLFKMKFDSQINSIMLNSTVMFTFSVLDRKYSFEQILSIKTKLLD